MSEETKDSYEFNTNLSSLEALVTGSAYLATVTYDQVKSWLKDHNRYNQQIRRTSRELYSANGVYTNVVDYMVSLPTLDKVVYSVNREAPEYKQAKEKYLTALRKIKDNQIARDILLKSATEGTCFYYFESNEVAPLPAYLTDLDFDKLTELNSDDFNCSVIPLPTDYCKIAGRKNSSYIVAFDMSYFDQFLSNGLSIKLKRYPAEIRNHYKTYIKDKLSLIHI